MVTRSIFFLLEAFDILGRTMINGVLYGIVLTLYCLCARPLYQKLRRLKPCRAMYSLGYISLLLICMTGFLSTDIWVIRLAYVNHADFPGGLPAFYQESRDPSITPQEIICNILDFAIEVLTASIQVCHQLNLSTGLNTPPW